MSKMFVRVTVVVGFTDQVVLPKTPACLSLRVHPDMCFLK